MHRRDTVPSIGECAALACALEVVAPKPGNVHRSADFETTTLQDFVVSAIVVGPILNQASQLRIGEMVLQSVDATARWVGTNTNLGLILLLAPLAKAAATAADGVDRAKVLTVLSELTALDARDVYAAIRLARPGGLGTTEKFDVLQSPPENLLVAMSATADRDSIARQFANGFEQVFDFVVPKLVQNVSNGLPLADAIIQTQMQTLAEIPDTLIGRKCGMATAQAAAGRAAKALQHPPGSREYLDALADFDFWLRADGNRRNPGTTADLIGAGLFVALRNGMIQLPLR